MNQRHYVWTLRILGAFWTLWYAIVAITNLTGWLQATTTFAAHWRFASANYVLVKNALEFYGPPDAVVGVIFAAVLVVNCVGWILFGRATFGAEARLRDAFGVANAVAMGIWAAFIIADELTFVYRLESGHLTIFLAHAACLLVAQQSRSEP